MKSTQLFLIMFVTAAPMVLSAQTADRLAVSFSDASRPGLVRANLIDGGITVKGYNGKQVIIDARTRQQQREQRESSAESHGMKRISVGATGLSVEEENNRMTIGADSAMRTIDLTITVPYRTSLELKTVNDGDIAVSNVDGELDIDDVNGSVTLTNVAGTAVAHALNGKVTANFTRVDAQKPMAFSSLNGDIDVTFPADLKANVSINPGQGEVYSDFDLQVRANAPRQIVEDSRNSGGKYRVRIDKTIAAAINGGGQEIQFKNFNGNIYIRKRGAAR